MKTPFKVICFCLVIATIIFLMLSRQRSTDLPSTVKQEGPQKLGANGSDLQIEAAQKKQIENRIEQVKQLGRNQNRPIFFYGKIVDENERGVSGVKVGFFISYYGNSVNPGLVPTRKQLLSTTDDNGDFCLENESGTTLEVKLTPKDGFEFKPSQFVNSYKYSETFKEPVKGSSRLAPVIFHASALGSSEPLINETINIGCDPDGQGYAVDLYHRINKRQNSQDSQLVISITRPDKADYYSVHPWSAKITMLGGGILESIDDMFMYQAPEEGYAKEWFFEMKIGSPVYKREIRKHFFFRTADNKYGRMEIEFRSVYRDKSATLITYWLNPSGSTNLRFDDNKRIAIKR